MSAIVGGRYVKGHGLAHKHIAVHDKAFGQRMVGTFNVRTTRPALGFVPTFTADNGWRYWKVLVNGKHEAWAYADRRGRGRLIWELLSREPLPAELKQGRLTMEVGE